MLGVAPENLPRTMRRLERQGIVHRRSRRRLSVPVPDRPRELAERGS
jgi:hypothetical protein